MDKSGETRTGKGIAESSSQRGSGSQPTTRNHHRIPGPAAVVQQTLERRRRGECEVEINTQEAVHRALTVEAEDTDFVDNPAWLNAIAFGYLDMPGYTDLASVKQLPSFSRVDLVVALVKCVHFFEDNSPWLELKDPTSTVQATIHHKAYEGKFAGKIKSGNCLVLTEITTFRAYTRSPTALNITQRNLEYVIEK